MRERREKMSKIKSFKTAKQASDFLWEKVPENGEAFMFTFGGMFWAFSDDASHAQLVWLDADTKEEAQAELDENEGNLYMMGATLLYGKDHLQEELAQFE
jgi:hypothetical protein